VRALAIAAPGRYALVTRPRPEPGPGELLVAPLAVGLCATDLELLDGSMVYLRTGRGRLPMVPGHEWVARVVDAGSAVSGFAAGDLVVGECSVGCGSCPTCTGGAYHQCPTRRETGVLNLDGALAGLLAFPAASAHPVPPTTSLVDAAFAEPTAVALRAVLRSGCGPGDRVLVVGGGTIGWLAVAIVLDLLQLEVAVLEPDTGRRAGLLRLGAREAEPEESFDVVIEASGSRSGAETALQHLGASGRLVVVGLSGEVAVPVDLDRVVVNDQTVVGSLGSPHVWPQALELLGRGRVRPAALVTHRYPLSEVATAVQVARQRAPGTGKVMVFPDEPDRE